MNILLITAHPNQKDSFTAGVVGRYRELSQNNPQTSLRVMDLYSPEWQQPYLTLGFGEEPEGKERQKRIQAEISRADELVFVHPLWWGGPPAVLKNWLDWNLSSGFAFKHEKGRSELQKRLWPLPSKRLLSKKTGKVFITGDGQFWAYLGLGLPFLVIWAAFIFLYTGIRPRSLRYFGGMMFRDKTETAEILDSITL